MIVGVEQFQRWNMTSGNDDILLCVESQNYFQPWSAKSQDFLYMSLTCQIREFILGMARVIFWSKIMDGTKAAISDYDGVLFHPDTSGNLSARKTASCNRLQAGDITSSTGINQRGITLHGMIPTPSGILLFRKLCPNGGQSSHPSGISSPGGGAIRGWEYFCKKASDLGTEFVMRGERQGHSIMIGIYLAYSVK